MDDHKKEFSYIEKKLKSCIGGGNISGMQVVITPFRKQGTTQVSVTLEIIKRYPIKDIEKANKLYNAIQKFHFDLEQIVWGK